MKLLTKEILKKATKQWDPEKSFEDKQVIAKFFNPNGAGTWYLIEIAPEDHDYCYGIVELHEIELGYFSIKELTEFRGRMGLGIERDLWFDPINAKDLYDKLKGG